jgi:hypothetical protein
MEIQALDLDLNTSLESINTSEFIVKNCIIPCEAWTSISSAHNGWRRLKHENDLLSTQRLDHNSLCRYITHSTPKITAFDEDLGDEIYISIEKALANLNLTELNGHVVTREEINALSPLALKICDLVKPIDIDSSSDKKAKTKLLEKLAFFGIANDEAQTKLLKHDIRELQANNDILVCAKGKAPKEEISKISHKVAKFWKKHKKEILITAAVIAAIVAVAVVAPAIGGAAGGAAALGNIGVKQSDKRSVREVVLDTAENLLNGDLGTVTRDFYENILEPVVEQIGEELLKEE